MNQRPARETDETVALRAIPAFGEERARPPPQQDAVSALRHLLQLESDIRDCKSLDELSTLLVNEIRKILGARHAYLIGLRSGLPRVEKVTGASLFDRNAPTVRWLEDELRARASLADWATPTNVTLRVGAAAEEGEGRVYPFPNAHWLPLLHEGRPMSGVLAVGESLFQEGATKIAARLVGTASHAAKVLTQRTPRARRSPRWRIVSLVAFVGTGAALCWPVPMTALGPLEVVARDPFVVAAPVDGVIETIVVAPNAPVKAGDLLVQYVDTMPRNQLRLAEREVNVADAKLRQLQQSAFVDERARHELAQARAELTLKVAEREFARDTLEKSQIRAANNGVAVYADRKEWVGKPVATGQRILEIADTSKVELRVLLPVAEILDLQPGGRVRAFLDGDPLRPLKASVTSASHQARVIEGQGLVYRIQAAFEPGGPLPRLGARGTAQVFSDKVALAYYLFRRPLTWVRQKFGL